MHLLMKIYFLLSVCISIWFSWLWSLMVTEVFSFFYHYHGKCCRIDYWAFNVSDSLLSRALQIITVHLYKKLNNVQKYKEIHRTLGAQTKKKKPKNRYTKLPSTVKNPNKSTSLHSDDFEPIHSKDEPENNHKPSVFEWMPSKHKRDPRKRMRIYPPRRRQHHCREPSQLETIEMVRYREDSHPSIEGTTLKGW